MMTQDEMNELMTQRFELEAAGEIDWQARAERAEARVAELEALLADHTAALQAELQRRAHAEARVAELEAGQGWRLANEPGIEAGRYETVSCPPRSSVIYDHMRYIPGEGWTGGAYDRQPDYYRPIAPPPQ